MASTDPFAQPIFVSQAASAAAASTPASSSNSPPQARPAMAMTMALAGRKRSSPSNTSYSTPVDGSTVARPGARRCSFPECAKTAKPGGFCISHGGGKKCAVSGCSTSVVSRGFCVAHGGGKRCQREGCTKSAQSGGSCWIHGGGKKCGFQGCVKRAQSGGACISHGGGKRCRIDNCNKVVQYDGLCVGHGGYRKCLSINCSKKALANSYCQSHGGNSQCSMDGCIRKAVKGGLCSDHKGSTSVITPVQNNPSEVGVAKPYPHHCIEPSKEKQQPSYALTSSSVYQSHRSQHNTSSPGKTLPSWQLKSQRSLEGLPEYSFAKDRPSLHMEPHHPHQGYDEGCGRGRSSFGTSPAMLPAIRTYSPLPTLDDLQSRPSLHLGTRKSSPISASSTGIGSPQPIKRLASLANIAKLSRPLTPLVGTVGAAGLSPPLVTRHRLRPSPSNFTHESLVATGSCQVGNCERFAKSNNLCLLHRSTTQAFQLQTLSSLAGHAVQGGSSS